MDIADHLQTFMKIDSLQTLADVIKFGQETPFAEGRLAFYYEHTGRFTDKSVPCGDPFTDEKRIAFRKAIEDEMDRQNIDVIVYPSWHFPPARIDAYAEGYKGDNSQVIAPHTGQPAFNVPMGFTEKNLPVGLQLLGRIFDEGRLIKVAYGYEQVTGHRKAAEF
jgi:Asp-tRNA(Asn)/Glu-tRNA(Gln) amidotransferase A subunit family amidase